MKTHSLIRGCYSTTAATQKSTYCTMSLMGTLSSLPSSVTTSTEKPVKACEGGQVFMPLKLMTDI